MTIFEQRNFQAIELGVKERDEHQDTRPFARSINAGYCRAQMLA
jgi:hypothetical protein